MIYTYTLEVKVENKSTKETGVIDLFIGLDDVREDLIGMVKDSQIKEEVKSGLTKPLPTDFEDEDEYLEALEEYETDLENAIEDYKSDMEFSDFDNFLTIKDVDGAFNIKLNDFEEVEEITSKMEEVDEDDWRIVVAIYNQSYSDLEQAIDIYTSSDYYWYPGMSLEEVVSEQIDSGVWGDIPDTIRQYLDLEAMARDLSYDGYSYDEDTDGVIAVL